MKGLALSNDLTLPVDAVTQTFLIVGKRGSGKSNTGARFVEQLHAAGLPFVVLDPTDTWWGLKATRDGGKGLGVYVFGGSHADLPLEPGAGALLANVLCEHRMPMVLSVKHLSGRARSAFMVAFAETLFQKWTGGPLHVVMEEAHELAPQLSGGGRGRNEDNEFAMLGAFKRLWKLGRASGIGGSAITQRPASLSKDITTQSEILIAHRTIGPQDVAAIGQWVKYHGEREDILAELPSLPTGQAFVWAPEFPEGKPIGLRRSTIYQRETFDSAATPKVGERRVEPKELAAVDLDQLRTDMAATIERAKADDPKLLRARIAELEKTAKSKSVPNSAPVKIETKVETKIVEKPIVTDAHLARIEKLVEKIAAAEARAFAGVQKAQEQWRDVTAAVKELAVEARAVRGSAELQSRQLPRTVSPASPRPATTSRVAVAPRVARDFAGDNELAGAEQRVLDAVAWWVEAGIEQPSRHQVAFVAKYTVNGHFNNIVGGLRTKGYLDYPGDGSVTLTPSGRATANAPTGDVTREELIARVRSVLKGESARRIFDVVVAVAPEPISRPDLAAESNYTVNGHFNNLVGSLHSLGAIRYPGDGSVVLSDLFEAVT